MGNPAPSIGVPESRSHVASVAREMSGSLNMDSVGSLSGQLTLLKKGEKRTLDKPSRWARRVAAFVLCYSAPGLWLESQSWDGVTGCWWWYTPSSCVIKVCLASPFLPRRWWDPLSSP
jgi:hypothetical protein